METFRVLFETINIFIYVQIFQKMVDIIPYNNQVSPIYCAHVDAFKYIEKRRIPISLHCFEKCR